jgi:aldehyde dehydrogenase (NAD+)
MSSTVRAEEQMLVGGRMVDARGVARYANINPATEEVIGDAPDGCPADFDDAMAAARAAFDETSWSADLEFRLRCLDQLQQGLARHADELRNVIVAEAGAPLALTFGPQLDTPVAGISWVRDLAASYQWRVDLGIAESFGSKSRRYIWREPAGVVAAIVPWNFPMQIQLAKVAPALAAGCTAVLKAAPATPWTTLLLGRIVAEETEIPAGVLNVITSSRNEAGQQLVEDPRVDLISFTGSTATGRTIMAAAAPTMKRLFLELGGKSALVVLDDADLSLAGVFAAFQMTTHAGQGCAITSRMLLPRSKYDQGLEALVETVRSMKYGDPGDSSNLMGPLISQGQRQRVLDYISSARSDGGTVVLGGGIPPHLPRGFFVEPTVISGLDPSAKAAREEIFGPVLCVFPYDDDEHAIAMANDSIYGLSGAVVGGDLERARAVAAKLRTGTVAINGGQWYAPSVPFGGYKQSGIGRESGVLGFEEYLEVKSVAEPA